MGGGPEEPAYLPVHAALALGTFQAEGVQVALRRVSHPTAAVEALVERSAAVAVATLDQAARGASSRGQRVRVLVAHTVAPAVALLGPRGAPDLPLEALRARRVGIPAPGATGHLVLLRLLATAGLDARHVALTAVPGRAVAGRLASGQLDAAMVEDPWVSRVVAAGGARILLDLRDPAVTRARLGGPFHEVASLVRADDAGLAREEASLAAFTRALIRVLSWLRATPPARVAARLGPRLGLDADRLTDRLAALQAAYAPAGEADETSLASTLQVLQAGRPWPADLRVRPADLLPPPLVTRARTALGPTPPEP